jgi:hypothetical protein
MLDQKNKARGSKSFSNKSSINIDAVMLQNFLVTIQIIKKLK